MGRFLASADSADTASLVEIYESNFTCVRVADDGGFVRLSREQMLAFLEQAVKDATARPNGIGHASVQTRETIIHHAELIGDTAQMLMIRVKDLGNGWEPMFYSLVWKKQGDDWRLWREFVHQCRLPKPQ